MMPTDPTLPALDPPTASDAPIDLRAEPTDEECHAEWIRFHVERNAGLLPTPDLPEGHYLAYFGGRILDHDPDMNLLRERAAASIRVHPARLVITYPWMW